MLNDKKIIVTGGNGFLGRHVIEELKNNGVPEKNIFVPRQKEYDLSKKEDMQRMFRDFKGEIVIHLAAHGGSFGIKYYKEHPGKVFYNNAVMGIFLLEEARKNNVEKVVIIGTGLAYPKDASIPYREEDLWAGYPEETGAPYGIASRLLVTQAASYRKEYGLNTIYVIPANLYGPGDNFEPEVAHVMPALITKIATAKKQKKESIEMWGSGKASREFLYVKDAAKAIILATKNYNSSEPLNIGTGKDTPLKKIVETVAYLMDYKGKIVWDSSKPEGQRRRCFDVTKAKKELGFEAEISLEEGIKETVEYYKTNIAK